MKAVKVGWKLRKVVVVCAKADADADVKRKGLRRRRCAAAFF